MGTRFLLLPAVASQLRVLYRSSSSGLDWPKSIREGSGLKPESPAGHQKKCNTVFIMLRAIEQDLFTVITINASVEKI